MAEMRKCRHVRATAGVSELKVGGQRPVRVVVEYIRGWITLIV